MSLKPILIVHPYDKTTRFLNKIKWHLIHKDSDRIHHFNIQPDAFSHLKCIERIVTHPKEGLIIYLGHGRSDKLYGSKGDMHGSIDNVSPEAIDENPSAYYYNDSFITKENCSIFDEKKVFCLACNSNGTIALESINNGSKVFLGFGDLPTSISEFEEKSVHVSNNFVAKMKGELNYIIKQSLTLGIQKNLTFQEVLDYIRFITSQRISDILVNNKGFKERRLLADYLYVLKKEVTIFGDRKLKLFN